MNHEYTPEFLARFWAKVDCTAGLFECWNWITSSDKDGYGLIRWHGSYLKSHRVSYELNYGSFPDELCVLHTCDNPRCCNPCHLFLGTQLDNARDREKKGRSNPPRGENHTSCKLSDSQIEEILHLFDLGYTNRSALGRFFGVSGVRIGQIVRSRKR